MNIEELKQRIQRKSTVFSAYPNYVCYLSSDNSITINGYENATPHSAHVNGEVKIGFMLSERQYLIFSDRVKERFIEDSSFEKHKGLKYIYEPLTESIAQEILSKNIL
jgi:hypothetical protein